MNEVSHIIDMMKQICSRVQDIDFSNREIKSLLVLSRTLQGNLKIVKLNKEHSEQIEKERELNNDYETLNLEKQTQRTAEKEVQTEDESKVIVIGNPHPESGYEEHFWSPSKEIQEYKEGKRQFLTGQAASITIDQAKGEDYQENVYISRRSGKVITIGSRHPFWRTVGQGSFGGEGPYQQGSCQATGATVDWAGEGRRDAIPPGPFTER